MSFFHAPKQHGPEQNIPGVNEVYAWRAAKADAMIITGIGAAIGSFIGGTVAGYMLHNPWFFHKPFLPASVIGVPIYSIIPVVISAIKYHQYPEVMKAVYTALGIVAVCTLPLGIMGVKKHNKARKKVLHSDVHGSAHWADKKEIQTSGLLPTPKSDPKYITYVGGWKNEKGELVYLQHSGPEHIIAFAPTRSGKGVGLVIPTLLAWMGSVLVHDIKGENWAITSGWRSTFSRCLKFAPSLADGTSCHFNPLNEIRLKTPHEVKDVQNIATMIVDPDGKGLNDHWAKTGFALLVGAILHVLYNDEIPEKSLRSVGALLANPDAGSPEETFEAMKAHIHDPNGERHWKDHLGRETKTHPVVAQSAQEMLNKAENEMSGVISTAMSFLALYRDDVVANNIASSDFSITDLMNQDKPISLYLVVPPSDKDRLKPLIRLIINQVVRRLTEDMAFKDGQSVANYRHRLLLMIDEFPSLGKLDIFEEALAFIAGYGLKAYLICQDKSQLDKSYTKDESIVSNSHVRIVYAPNKIETAEWISRILGKRTITTENTSISYAGGNVMPYQTGMSGGLQYQARELLTPDEVMRLKGPVKNAQGKITVAGDMVVLTAGGAPIYGQQIMYFMDPVFSRRSRILPPDQAAVIPDDAPSQVSASIPTVDFGDAVVSVMTENMNKVMDKALADNGQDADGCLVTQPSALDGLDAGAQQDSDHGDAPASTGSALDSLDSPDSLDSLEVHDDPDAAAEAAAADVEDAPDYESAAICDQQATQESGDPMKDALVAAMAEADKLVDMDAMDALAIAIDTGKTDEGGYRPPDSQVEQQFQKKSIGGLI